MNEVIKRVVGVVFIQDGKLLIVKSLRSSQTNSWTLVGGGIETGENPLRACIREVNEELNGFNISEDDLEPIMCFKEAAASNPNIMIEMNLFSCSKNIDVNLIANEEILAYHWFKVGETDYNLSSSIRDYFLPYAIEKGLLY